MAPLCYFVFIFQPSPDHEGTYHCKFMYLDKSFKVQHLDANVYVNVTGKGVCFALLCMPLKLLYLETEFFFLSCGSIER